MIGCQFNMGSKKENSGIGCPCKILADTDLDPDMYLVSDTDRRNSSLLSFTLLLLNILIFEIQMF